MLAECFFCWSAINEAYAKSCLNFWSVIGLAVVVGPARTALAGLGLGPHTRGLRHRQKFGRRVLGGGCSCGCRNSCAAFLHSSTSLINIARCLGSSVCSAARAQSSAWRSYKRARSGMACPLEEGFTDLSRAALTRFNATGTKLTQENTLIRL